MLTSLSRCCDSYRAVDKLIDDVHALKASNPTMRDQFAIAAMTGFMCNTELMEAIGGKSIVESFDKAAAVCYGMADAMMEARK